MLRGITVLSVTALLLAACGGSSEPEPTPTPAATPTPTTRQVSGTFVLYDVGSYRGAPIAARNPAWSEPVAGKPCHGVGGYSDLRAGMQVQLTADGKTLDVATITDGTFGARISEYSGLTPCTFSFTLDVPPGHEFYTVAMGRRGERTYSFDELTTPGTLAFEIGR